ncbi:hypothetical protein CfE428DRAFT_4808 [Chthoniobacter flavus Ellin428]|uniref:Uncharacterized protein n=1 Tax=Chthoniobacter flavus Ellin428 TaxID=497964 RepID=B4D7B8_9BACT|nr:hypothetical protein [Chthoniobacter flavus]EDY17769.1 hypothetical protein CfE428DRAFT_4808 [Chthoniobacter flavus Ellin428]TCO87093.1 hypothetical protein EV701_12470 [Chthoniobacter flavus]
MPTLTPTVPPMLTYLAMVIDLREERLEKTTIPFLQKQISVELERLLQRFETEYRNYLAVSGNADPVSLLKSAA